MAKDFTDYVCLIYRAGERVYHIEHIRQLRGDPVIDEFKYEGHVYWLNKNRAMRIRGWQPWRKVDIMRIFWSLNELTRSKKVGLVAYMEPNGGEPQYKIIERKVPTAYRCKECGTRYPKLITLKQHIGRSHKGVDVGGLVVVEFKVEKVSVPNQDRVAPMHISRIHQPSGELRG